MINNRAQYIFVSGDLDRILINGEILPLRSAATKKVLRGEDIAFLMEAKCERTNAAYEPSPQSTATFSREILARQPSAVSSFIDTQYSSGSIKWIRDSADWQSKLAVNQSIYNSYPGNFLTVSDKEGSSSFARGDQLLLTPVETLFKNMKKLNRWGRTDFSGYTSPSSWSLINIVKDDTEYSEYVPENPQNRDIYKYHMVMDGGRYWDVDAFGSDEWKCSNGTLTVNVTEFMKSVTVMLDVVVDEYNDDEQNITHVFVNIGTYNTTSGTSIEIGPDALFGAATTAMSLAGVSPIPYPGRKQGKYYYQEIHVTAMSTYYCICELRDRTRW